jgi:hypothetical protein
MKIKEVTNPEEQLGLLRVIIDNTWSAIKQQADAHARQKAIQPPPRLKSKTAKAPKPAPYTVIPKPVIKPKQPYKAPQVGTRSLKPASASMPTPLPSSLVNNEKDDSIKLPREIFSKPF